MRFGDSSCFPVRWPALVEELGLAPEPFSGELCWSPAPSVRCRASRCWASWRRRSRASCWRRSSACMSCSFWSKLWCSLCCASSRSLASSLNLLRTSASHSSCSFRRFRASSVSFCSLRISRLCCSSKRFCSRARRSRACSSSKCRFLSCASLSARSASASAARRSASLSSCCRSSALLRDWRAISSSSFAIAFHGFSCCCCTSSRTTSVDICLGTLQLCGLLRALTGDSSTGEPAVCSSGQSLPGTASALAGTLASLLAWSASCSAFHQRRSPSPGCSCPVAPLEDDG
mmetsp:Transcript_667/g.1740  ORF Transcript_667/g.1740 Transcript_667/m.1740 type:complete len:289 (+) Transcript_667:328-1194(+)